MRSIANRLLAATSVGVLSAVIGASAATAAPTTTPAAGASSPTAAYGCGRTLVKDPSGVGTLVYYRHCTSGSDSLRVRAIIGAGGDGPCTTVGPNSEKRIHRYVSPAYFSSIARC